MNIETTNAIAARAAENVFIVKTDKESYDIKNAMRNAAAAAIRDTEMLNLQAVDYYQQRYLTTLEDGAEKDAVEKAFDAVLADLKDDKSN